MRRLRPLLSCPPVLPPPPRVSNCHCSACVSEQVELQAADLHGQARRHLNALPRGQHRPSSCGGFLGQLNLAAAAHVEQSWGHLDRAPDSGAAPEQQGFMLLSLQAHCQTWGTFRGGTWRPLSSPPACRGTLTWPPAQRRRSGARPPPARRGAGRSRLLLLLGDGLWLVALTITPYGVRVYHNAI